MDKTYDPRLIEERWYKNWEERGWFKPNKQNHDNPYCIMIPPPNVTGSLHMGHGFNNTIMDTLIRYNRMCSRSTLWQPGTDHAGIATQMVVERQLEKQNKTRHDLGRENFIKKIWEWKKESGDAISMQLRRLGSSLDWENERFTMDEGLSNAVKEVFVRLYEEGLIYRGKRLVNWDPKLHTAVSDLEVLSEEEDGFMWDIKYPLDDGSGFLTVSTTRPETMLGDCAVAVNPEDKRYINLIGKNIKLPLTDRAIPVIADEHADPEFGTGCVKITPAHDFNDYEVWLRNKGNPSIQCQYQGGLINIFNPDASIRSIELDGKSEIPTRFIGMDRYKARKAIVSELSELDLIQEIKTHKLTVPRGDRSGVVIEPFLTDQWYVKVGPLADPAIEAVRNGDIKFVPDSWKNTYFDWMNNIQDWCISRQIWWGHRIPAWFDKEGNIFVGRTELEIREKNNLPNDYFLKQDEDVLDTWFSSALWPFSTLGWPENTDRLNVFYPTNVLVTGFDIIFFWVARMIMMGLKFMDGKVPFHEIYVHGLVRDASGQKMSKSKGNVLDPIDLIDGISLEDLISKRTSGMMQPQLSEKIKKQTKLEFPNGIPSFGTDSLRFTFAALAATGRDIKFDMKRIDGYRNFCNKLWNAARFVITNTEKFNYQEISNKKESLTVNKWINSELQEAIKKTRSAIEAYRFDLAANTIYEFTWDNYCSWYLELSKVLLNDENISIEKKNEVRKNLIDVLEQILLIAHPIIPFITEEIWQKVSSLKGQSGETIMCESYPQFNEDLISKDSLKELKWLKHFISEVRSLKGEMNVAPGTLVPILLADPSEQDREYIKKNIHYLQSLAKVNKIEFLSEGTIEPESAMAILGQMRILIPMANLINKDAEINRLEKETSKLLVEIERIENKLKNNNFIKNAPELIIQKEKNKLQEAKINLKKLTFQKEKIEKIS